MDNKLLLNKAITLLYRESLANAIEPSNDMVKTVLEEVKVPDTVIGINREREIVIALKKTLLEMCENSSDHEYLIKDLLPTLKANCLDDEAWFKPYNDALSAELTSSELSRSIINLRKNIQDHFREQQVAKILNKASWSFVNERSKIKNVPSFLAELNGLLDPFTVSTNKKDPAIIEKATFSPSGDQSDTINVFSALKEQTDGIQVLRTGWQAINDMLNGGLLPGEEVLLPALQHNWKSGFSLTLFKQFCQYNKAWAPDPTKKPLLIRISAEDSLKMNFQFLYKSLKENETGETFKGDDTTPAERADYVIKNLTINGWTVDFLFIDPSKWTIRDLFNYIIEKESEGYSVTAVMLDYLLKLPTTGCTQGPLGVDIRNMFERVKAFFSSRSCIFLTPHQLSSDAKQLIRDGRQDFVKNLPGMGYYSGSKQIDQVIDIELFLHIEKFKNQGRTSHYLTIQLGKFRRVEQVEEEKKFVAFKFLKKGVILDDVGKANSGCRRVGGEPIGSGGEEIPYWDYDQPPDDI